MKNVLCSRLSTASLFSISVLFAASHAAFAQAPPNVTFLHAFTGGTAGADPVTPVVQAPGGNLFGVTFGAGAFRTTPGLFYSVTPGGVFTPIHKFPATGSEGGVYRGNFYYASLMQASDGNFYGTFPNFGSGGQGTVYRMTPSGVFTLIHAFAGTSDGAQPIGPLTEAFDGNLYGVTEEGPSGGAGTLFRVGLDGTFSTIYLFAQPGPEFPISGLTLSPDGNLYGVTSDALYRFGLVPNTATSLFQVQGANEFTSRQPVLGFDNRLYFSSVFFDLCSCPFGALVSFDLDGSGPEFPYVFSQLGTYGASNLTLAGSGDYYSVFDVGGVTTGESVSIATQMSTSAALGGVGSILNGDLTQIASGELAGTTYGGGDGGNAAGTLFLWGTGENKPAPFILGFQPTTASVGQTVTIWGRNFTGSTGLTINDVSAAFKTAASGFLSFTVPEGASSSAITVTNAGGSTTSTGVLTIQ